MKSKREIDSNGREREVGEKKRREELFNHSLCPLPKKEIKLKKETKRDEREG